MLVKESLRKQPVTAPRRAWPGAKLSDDGHAGGGHRPTGPPMTPRPALVLAPSLLRAGGEQTGAVLGATDLHSIDAYWRAANYCSVGQIYLLDNPLLREPLRAEHTKPRLMGHFGTTPGLNLIYAHLNRVIVARDLDMIYVIGPGHGGPGIVANSYLEGTYSECLPPHHPRRGGPPEALPSILLPGRHPQPRIPGDPGLDPRGRRTGLLPRPRLWGGLRQSGPHRGLCDRRWRG